MDIIRIRYTGQPVESEPVLDHWTDKRADVQYCEQSEDDHDCELELVDGRQGTRTEGPGRCKSGVGRSLCLQPGQCEAMNMVVARDFGNLFVGYSVKVLAGAFGLDLRRNVSRVSIYKYRL